MKNRIPFFKQRKPSRSKIGHLAKSLTLSIAVLFGLYMNTACMHEQDNCLEATYEPARGYVDAAYSDRFRALDNFVSIFDGPKKLSYMAFDVITSTEDEQFRCTAIAQLSRSGLNLACYKQYKNRLGQHIFHIFAEYLCKDPFVNPSNHQVIKKCVNDQDRHGQTPLHLAVGRREGEPKDSDQIVETAGLLLSLGADINCCDARDQSPLHIAVENGDIKLADFLLSHGADLNQKKKESEETPLTIAVRNGHIELVKFLLSKRAIIHFHIEDYPLNTSLYNPLFSAVEKGSIPIVELLLNHGARLDYAVYWMNPLFIAVNKENIPLVEFLLNKGADPNYFNLLSTRIFYFPLCIAAEKGNIELAKLLLSHRADPNRADSQGQTPLLIATRNNNTELVELLLSHGANPD